MTESKQKELEYLIAALDARKEHVAAGLLRLGHEGVLIYSDVALQALEAALSAQPLEGTAPIAELLRNNPGIRVGSKLYAAPQPAAAQDGWQRMESCPKDQKVLFWNDEWEEVSIGHQPEDAPVPNDVVVARTRCHADKWMPLPAAPSPGGKS